VNPDRQRETFQKGRACTGRLERRAKHTLLQVTVLQLRYSRRAFAHGTYSSRNLAIALALVILGGGGVVYFYFVTAPRTSGWPWRQA
jgi:hypothetical protein